MRKTVKNSRNGFVGLDDKTQYELSLFTKKWLGVNSFLINKGSRYKSIDNLMIIGL